MGGNRNGCTGSRWDRNRLRGDRNVRSNDSSLVEANGQETIRKSETATDHCGLRWQKQPANAIVALGIAEIRQRFDGPSRNGMDDFGRVVKRLSRNANYVGMAIAFGRQSRSNTGLFNIPHH